MNEPIVSSTPERILQRLDWQIIRRLDGLLQGDYQTLFYGNGIDFADLREYEPRDDIRHIDWNVTARMNTPYVRQYVEDRDITAWFLLDLSPSMTFGNLERPKETVLVELTVLLARLLTNSNNRVGAILYRDKVEKTIPPQASKNQVLRLTRELLNQSTQPTQTPTQLGDLLYAGLNSIKRRSLIFIVSDFISEPGWERPLHLLNQRHEIVAVRLWDPAEQEIPDVGVMVVEDAETGEQIYVDTSHPEFRQNYEALVQQREAALNQTLKRASVDSYNISTAANLLNSVLQMIALRKKRRRL